MKKNNPFVNTRIEFHVLQPFPVTCLNRDDVGAPKTAMIGGTTRARVSSQCWKRQVRLLMNQMGIIHGSRTKLLSRLIEDACIGEGATEEQAKMCGLKVENIFIKKQETKSKKKSNEEEVEGPANEDNDTLLFLSPREVKLIAQAFKEAAFNPENVIKEKDPKKQTNGLKKLIDPDLKSMDAADIALFGRMVAKASFMKVEAAASFAHAISTHKVSNEIDFFTAIDDFQEGSESAHMGTLEFNSATYYRYVCLDLGQLWQTTHGESFFQIVEAFIKALYLAVPAARQATQSGASPWEYAKIFVRKGQRLQVPFETAIKAKDGGFLQPSIDALTSYLKKKELVAGSLFGKQAEFTLGDNEDFSVDHLLAEIKSYLEKVVS